MAKVAFVGLGVMGYPMAGHLTTKAGHEVTVFNRTKAKADKWVAQYGGKGAPTPKAASEGQDFIMACVGNDNDVREVMLGSDGIFAGARKGAIVVDHTTASAEIARGFTPKPSPAALTSSTRRCRADRPAPRTACSR